MINDPADEIGDARKVAMALGDDGVVLYAVTRRYRVVRNVLGDDDRWKGWEKGQDGYLDGLPMEVFDIAATQDGKGLAGALAVTCGQGLLCHTPEGWKDYNPPKRLRSPYGAAWQTPNERFGQGGTVALRDPGMFPAARRVAAVSVNKPFMHQTDWEGPTVPNRDIRFWCITNDNRLVSTIDVAPTYAPWNPYAATVAPGGDSRDWFRWTFNEAPPAFDVAATRHGDRRVQVWMLDDHGGLRTCQQTGRPEEDIWSPWSEPGWNSAPPLRAIAAVQCRAPLADALAWSESVKPDLMLFGVTHDYTLVATSQHQGGGWGAWSAPGWQSSGHVADVAAAQTADGRIVVCAVTLRGKIHFTLQSKRGVDRWEAWSFDGRYWG